MNRQTENEDSEAGRETETFIKVHVVSSDVVPTDEPNNKVREITVDVIKDFKKNVQGDRIILTTAEHSATCGVSLSDDSCYVVTGTFEEGNPLRYRFNTCGFHMKCSAITDLQWRGLKRGYGKACSSNCKVLSPYEDENATGCRMNPKQNDIPCLQNYGICQRCDRRRCNRRRLRCWWRIARNPNRRCTRN
ncbi:unnamed protein product [Mytilus coruscus]|uniref:NTR domain-containing protein n=1 Tax=Mytilus coruscus TaxID=42192 RepID=A0A6J7ZW28_MYTCO|nr:unnamed protein product [Mytilus coruscus]